MILASTQRRDLVAAAQVLARLGLVTAYGHVSARAEGGPAGPAGAPGRPAGRMLITPAADLATVSESDLVDVSLDASSLPLGAPAETWAHLALYRARPDAGAIARAQPPSAFAAAAVLTAHSPAAAGAVLAGAPPAGPGAGLAGTPPAGAGAGLAGAAPAGAGAGLAGTPPAGPGAAISGPARAAGRAPVAALPPLHGQAAWLGESVPVHDSALLLRSADLAEHAARRLPAGEALLLRGNGALTLGVTPGVAVARMWLLSAACDVWLTARAAGEPAPLTVAEIASWRAVAGELLPRLWHTPIPASAFLQPRAEPEIALVLSRALPGPGLGVADLLSATAYALPAIEIIDSRITDWRISLEDTIADNASSGGLVLGAVATPVGGLDLSLLGCVLRRNGRIQQTGAGAAVMGSPLHAATWLANTLTARGAELAAGHIILTGSMTAAVAVQAGDTVTATIDQLGSVTAVFD